MKAMKRKLLSLLLAMAMVLTLAPTALAEDKVSANLGGAVMFDIQDDGTSGGNNENSGDGDNNETPSGGGTETPGDGNNENPGGDGDENPDDDGTKTPVATGVTISPATAVAVEVGKTIKLSATVASDTDVSQTVSWTSGDPSIATVDQSSGVVTGVKAGTVKITATAEAKGANNQAVSATIDVTVKNPAATATGEITTTANTFQANGRVAFLLTVSSGAENVKDVVWSCDNPTAVTFQTNNGTLTNGSTTVTVNLLKAGSVTITATMRDSSDAAIGTATKSITISSPLTITPNQQTLTYYGQSVTLTAYYGNDVATNVSWSIEDASTSNPYNNGYVTLSPLATAGRATVTAVATTSRTTPTYIRATYVVGGETFTASCPIYTSYTGASFATATVYSDNNGYALGDVDDANKTSIVDQLDSYFYSTANGRYGVAYVRFTSTTSGNYGSLNASTSYDYYTDRYTANTSYRSLRDVLFYPGTTRGTASFPVTVYYYTSNNYQSSAYINSVSGTITFNVTEGTSTGDIAYTASIGDDVSFDMKDFEDFYYSKTKGSLSYVSFTLPSGGSLYADGGRLSASNACYVSPSRTQTDLAGVYFSPTGTTATRASTVRINFTAYGNRSNTSGTVAITYLAGTAKDITYNISTSGTLKASDFTDAYKAVVGSTAPTGLTIQFQTVPTYGTLTYKDSSRTNSTAVTLRSSNIKSYNFTTRSTGSNQLADVTYTASGTRSDTIEYIAYVNSTPQFTGKVVFNGSNASASNMQVSFTSTGGQPVAFSYNAFVTANATAMASTSYIRFVTMPTGGALTYNGAAMSLTSTNVLPALLGSVVYRPNTGYNNSTDRISFVCYDANGNSVGGGQVSIIVTGNTSSSSGANTVNQFKDVTATAWYRNDLITLVNAGIIQGRGDGKFDPTAELTYGEALKIFMLASGYPAQAEASGKDWAINYKNLAVSNGWISSDIDLSAKISRNAMAELAAKSLGVSPSSSVPPTWKDGTSNSYANALYYTSPQILIGNADGTFKGTSTLLRQEICAIASRVLSYKANQQSMEKPGWIG